MIVIDCTIRGKPIGWKAPNCDHGRHYTPQHYADYKHYVAECLQIHRAFHPGYVPNKKDRHALSLLVWRPSDTGDLTNFQKGIEDALQLSGIIWNDKSIVIHREPFEMRIDKIDPRIWLRLEVI